ncbi:MAG: aminotransferase class I/II-fold pyridoxal phosphate-dependent enzyme [Nitrospirae bacterium]|nr:aminotransferase class I/II-fold pyridoxal phosphate-dependent enzyme [Nitrospirota bacterium]
MPIDPTQYKTPLFDAMVSLAEARKISFHTPGHKSGKGIATRFVKYVGHKIFSIDLTTLDEVDSLQRPTGVIKEAQELAAKAYGADRSFFLVNGTSVGNHAMVMSACGPGSGILMARNCHKSVVAGTILAGATPHYIHPEVDIALRMTMNVSFDAVKAAIEAHPWIKTLFVTSPNYYGICADLSKIIPFAHERGMAVLVDEAHGPHLGFHPELPPSALSLGADMCVQSTHKIIGGMTQASMMHIRGGRLDAGTLAGVLKFVQTTSPSYILMASLDLARMQMATEGEKLLEKTLTLARDAREHINKIPGLYCLDKETVMTKGLGGLDETKLAINVSGMGLSGYEVSQTLNLEYGIQVEMSDPFHVLVIVSIGDRNEDLDLLVDALESISEKSKARHGTSTTGMVLPRFNIVHGLTPREAFFAAHEYAPVEGSAGRLSSEIVTVYPPGIPLLVPGEVITEEVITYLTGVSGLGGFVDGLSEDGRIGVVKAG